MPEGRAVYGVTTGFGALCDVAIPREQTRALQENILMSHAAGVGEPLPDEVVRATMAVRDPGPCQGPRRRAAGDAAGARRRC